MTATITNDRQTVSVDTFDINVLKDALECYANVMWESYQEYLKQGKERKSHREKFERALNLSRAIDKVFTTEWQCLLKQNKTMGR